MIEACLLVWFNWWWELIKSQWPGGWNWLIWYGSSSVLCWIIIVIIHLRYSLAQIRCCLWFIQSNFYYHVTYIFQSIYLSWIFHCNQYKYQCVWFIDVGLIIGIIRISYDKIKICLYLSNHWFKWWNHTQTHLLETHLIL